MRYFLHIGYHGAKYSGWQKHSGVLSVQQVLENCLTQVLKQPIAVAGCGRTDAQVHAAQFFVHIDVAQTWSFDLLFRLNKLLPADIAVFDIYPMGHIGNGLPHARFDATQRAYDYFIHRVNDPFLSGFSSLYLIKKLDFDAMKKAIALLPLYDDYSALCTSPGRNEHNICRVSKARLFVSPGEDKIRFHIAANRFLGKMVRIIMGKLLLIGEGKLSVAEFEHYLISKQTPPTITPAYPQGLYLKRVIYPYLDIPAKSTFTALLALDVEQGWIQV